MITNIHMGGGSRPSPSFIYMLKAVAIIIMLQLLGVTIVTAKVTEPLTLSAKLISKTKETANLHIEVIVTTSIKSSFSLQCDTAGLSVLEGEGTAEFPLKKGDIKKFNYIINRPDKKSNNIISFTLKSATGIMKKTLIKVNGQEINQLKAVIKNGIRETGP